MTHTDGNPPQPVPLDLSRLFPKSTEPAAESPRCKPPRRRIVFGSLLVLFAGGAVLLTVPAVRSRLMEPASADAAFETAAVEAAPFRLTIEAKGTVGSARNATLTSELRGYATIISLIPAGTFVEDPVKSQVFGTVTEVRTPESGPWDVVVTDRVGREFSYRAERVGEFTSAVVDEGDVIRSGEILIGDIVCEFDRSELEEDEKEYRIKLTKAKAAFETARKNVEIRIAQNESNLAAAELKAHLAKLDLQTYTDGEFPQKRDNLQGQIEESRQNLTRAKETLAYTQRLAQKGYKDFNDVEAARQKVLEAGLKLNNLDGELGVLEVFTQQRTELKLREGAVNASHHVVRVRLANEASVAQLRALQASRERSLSVYQERWEWILQQLKACTLVAPQAGQVVYARNRYSRSSQLIEEGTLIREQQAVIHIPDKRRMKVDARIHESMIGRIRLGLPASIRIDSLPGVSFKSRLTDISSVPLPGNFPNYHIREYSAEISIDDSCEFLARLNPGMTAKVEITIEHANEDLPQIPVQSIVTAGDETFAWVMTDDGAERRSIALGPSNDKTFVVQGGLSSGEEVVLHPREHFVAEIDELELAFAADFDSWSDDWPTAEADVRIAESAEDEEPDAESAQAATQIYATQQAACTDADATAGDGE